MQANKRPDKTRLTFRKAFFDSETEIDAYRGLMSRVFAIKDTSPCSDPTWLPFAYFDGQRCVASIEAATLPIVLDRQQTLFTALRRVGVAPDWRGHGLFQDLMTRALAWCETRRTCGTLLFSGTPALYEPFGFRTQAQASFVGDMPTLARELGQPLTRLHLGNRDHAALIRRLVASRAPVSRRCALLGAGDLVMDALASNEDWVLGYVSALDALIVHAIEARHLTLIDVIAANVPSLAAIVATMPLRPDTLTMLFHPDRFCWDHAAVDDDTGLMVRGPVPLSFDAMARFPPTAEF